MRNVTVAATQMACSWELDANRKNAESLIREAAGAGANVILIQELFATPYFCIEQDFDHLELAETFEDSHIIKQFSALAKELGVVLPTSYFEKAGTAYFNSVAMIDATGEVLGNYRKTHIPNAIGYQEKTYFNPGDTGFRVWDTQFGKLGVGICWDQWFPEAARCMALQGAEILLYPTAIGSEPGDVEGNWDSAAHWQNAMCGHAAANIVPVVASNRIATEYGTKDKSLELTFYGSSFIADQTGVRVAEADRQTQSVLTHTFDLDEIDQHRRTWGVYRDRRPECYDAIRTLDGVI